MAGAKTQFVIDPQGNRTAVLIDVETYQKMLDELDLYDAIRALDEALAHPGERIPFEQAIKEIESRRNDL